MHGPHGGMDVVAAEEYLFVFFSSRRRHTRCLSDWSSDVCSSDLPVGQPQGGLDAEPDVELEQEAEGDRQHPEEAEEDACQEQPEGEGQELGYVVPLVPVQPGG